MRRTVASLFSLQGDARRRLSRASFAFFKSIQTRWSDNDQYGHVNNVAYYSFVDTCVNAWEQRIGEPVSRNARGLVVDTGCTYFEPTSFPEALDVGLGVMRLGRSSVRYRFGIFREGADLPAAQGHYVHVYVDAATQRPCDIPDDIRTALAAHKVEDATSEIQSA
jgi:acyl-CoA thioester hydrolase